MDNKTLLQNYVKDVWQKRDLDAIDRYVDKNYVQHAKHAQPGREGLRAFFAMLSEGFSALTYGIDNVLAEGDRVCWRWSLRAQHTGPLMGVPASGKAVTVTGISIVRVKGGKFTEHWGEQDMLGLMQQLKG